MSNAKHQTRVRSYWDTEPSGRRHRAECSCGWVSRIARSIEEDAETDADEHILAVGDD